MKRADGSHAPTPVNGDQVQWQHRYLNITMAGTVSEHFYPDILGRTSAIVRLVHLPQENRWVDQNRMEVMA